MDRETLLQQAKQKLSATGSESVPGVNRLELIAKAKEKLAATQKPEEDIGLISGAIGGIQDIGQSALENIALPILSSEPVQKIGKFADTYLGAPTRAAIGAAQNDQNPISAYTSQFGDNPENAPTGKELAQRAGFSEQKLSDGLLSGLYSESGEGAKLKRGGLLDPTASGAAGLVLDISADPSNLLPVSAAAKGVAGLAKPVVSGISKGLVKGGSTIAKAIPGVEAAYDIGKGTKDIVVDTAKGIGTGLSEYLSPSMSPEFKKSVEVAIKNKIDPSILPDSIKYKGGIDSSISRTKRRLAQEVGGEKYLLQHEAAHKGVRDAFDRKIQEVSGGTKGFSPSDSGDILREGYNSSKKQFFDKMDATYQNVSSQLPKNAPLSTEASSKLINYLKKLKTNATAESTNAFLKDAERAEKASLSNRLDGLIRNLEAASNPEAVFDTTKPIVRKMSGILRSKSATAAQKTQAMNVLNDIGGFREAHQFGNYDAINKLRADVGGTLKKGSSVLALSKKELGEFYHKLSESLRETTKDYLGEDFSNKLKANNESMTEWFKNAEQVEDVLNEASPEKVYKYLIESGNTDNLRALKNVLVNRPDVIQKMKASFLENLKYLDKQEGFGFPKIGAQLRNNDNAQIVLKELFSPEEIKDIKELVKLGEDLGPAKLNYSQTDEARSFSNIKESIARKFENEGFLKLVESNAAKKALKSEKAIPKGVSEMLVESAPIQEGGGLMSKTRDLINKKPRRGKYEMGLIKGPQSIAPQSYREKNE